GTWARHLLAWMDECSRQRASLRRLRDCNLGILVRLGVLELWLWLGVHRRGQRCRRQWDRRQYLPCRHQPDLGPDHVPEQVLRLGRRRQFCDELRGLPQRLVRWRRFGDELHRSAGRLERGRWLGDELRGLRSGLERRRRIRDELRRGARGLDLGGGSATNFIALPALPGWSAGGGS